MSFSTDLKVGKIYEREVCDLFEILFDRKFRQVTKEDDPNLYLHLDIIEEQPRNKRKKHLTEMLSAECKYSGSQHDDSPNVVVEYQSYGKTPSGICTSFATFWVFKAGNFHLIAKREELIRTILFDLGHTSSHRQIKTKTFDKKTLLLVPIELLLSKVLCPSTQKIPTKESYHNVKT